MINKITTGFVVQEFDEVTKKCVSQEFVAGDEVEWEALDGMPIDDELVNVETLPYQPFNMMQPNDKDEVEREYLEAAHLCPKCKSDEIDGVGGYDAEGDEIFHKVECLNCGTTWTDRYKLNGYQDYCPNDVFLDKDKKIP